MRIGILGTGNLAEALGGCWVRAGHRVTVAGRSADRAAALADRLGGAARAAAPRRAVYDADAVLLAVPWGGIDDMLRDAGAVHGSLAGVTVIDPINAVEHGVGVLLTEPGASTADRIAATAPGSRVVKGFHMVPSTQWGVSGPGPTTVPLCGDDPAALAVAETLVRDTGAVPAVVGGLSRARQLDEAAGLFISLAFAGVDPRTVLPTLPPVHS
ncbi:NAD(P)-binding domain-containing protein [Nocardia sp. NPDC019395]|uniref:NADPH-dependent F420 reductase n=1 Tax=Nocardia sp. NPDC019395 TaxID=3154686 RepID=UPI0033C624ED